MCNTWIADVSDQLTPRHPDSYKIHGGNPILDCHNSLCKKIYSDTRPHKHDPSCSNNTTSNSNNRIYYGRRFHRRLYRCRLYRRRLYRRRLYQPKSTGLESRNPLPYSYYLCTPCLGCGRHFRIYYNQRQWTTWSEMVTRRTDGSGQQALHAVLSNATACIEKKQP